MGNFNSAAAANALTPLLASSVSKSLGTGNSSGNPAAAPDMRVRLGALNPKVYSIKGDKTDLMYLLTGTRGVLFPYSPQIGFSQDVSYNAAQMVNTNNDYETYTRTPSVSITISGKFSIQNRQEGQYALAAIHFMRTVSKMYFGEAAGANAGLPPPMLLLNGYGKYMFNNLRCILKSHSFNYEEQVDTVAVYDGAGSVIARLPSLFSLSCTVQVQQTPYVMRTVFDLDKFRSGALIASGGGFI